MPPLSHKILSYALRKHYFPQHLVPLLGSMYCRFYNKLDMPYESFVTINSNDQKIKESPVYVAWRPTEAMQIMLQQRDITDFTTGL